MNINSNTQTNRIWKCAAYVRLSKEDEFSSSGIRDVSNSITNQKALIRDYMDQHPELELIEEYADDGYTGVNFNRPAFKKMMEDVKARRIDCIIVKDLSRFGRNYIEAGKYLEQVFPFLGVRFIAITDDTDTGRQQSDCGICGSHMGYFRTNLEGANPYVMYQCKFHKVWKYGPDACPRENIRLEELDELVLREMQKEIDYPLGYKKDPDLPGHYIKDPETAIYIELLFEWYQEGLSMTQIAARFTDLNVPSSSRIRYMRSKNRKKLRNRGRTHWNATAIKQILSNPVYVGDLALRKSQNRRYTLEGPKTFDRSEWIIRENVHEPYISRDLYNRILEDIDHYRELNANRRKVDHVARALNPYRTLIKCGVYQLSKSSIKFITKSLSSTFDNILP